MYQKNNFVIWVFALFLSDVELKKMLEEDQPIVSELIDTNTQVQQIGIDFTVKEIQKFEGSGNIDFSNKERVNAKVASIDFDQDDWVFLPKGTYMVIYNEYVNLPSDIMMVGMPRSTLVRNGCTMGLGFVDPGYSGRMTSLFTVHNEHGLKLKKNARVVQWGFIKISEKVKELYDGIYKEENTV